MGSVAMGNRRCDMADTRVAEGAACGDATDCNLNLPTACEVRSQTCSTTLLSTLGAEDSGVTRVFLSPGADQGSLLPDLSSYYCALPGVLVSGGSNPCCYDRDRDGGITTCMATGTCTCNDDTCATNPIAGGYRCPF